ncbi:MAG: polyisoprenoid-binding protein [Ignavibacteriales bacterium]|nr:polyisoprenoid-binding protein [Ignavibacteriales bacterium]
MKRLLSIIYASLMVVITVNAQTTWKLDQAHSTVSFNISHMVISEVSGRFTDFDVTLVNKKDDFKDGKLNTTIKVKSINTDNEGRDKHLRSADFFDAEKYPEMTFVSKSFEKTGKNTYKIVGDLTIHGIAKPITLETKYNGTMTDPWGNIRTGFKATTTVNRKEFGIVYNQTLETGGLLLGEDVDVTINVELTKEKK